jgi:hypothetical protein
MDINMKCIFCNKEIVNYGNNAQPLAKGICCSDCNMKKVIPYRLKLYKLKGGDGNNGN